MALSSSAGLALVSAGAAFAEGDCRRAATIMRDANQAGARPEVQEAQLREAVALCPSMAEAHHNLGVVLLQQKKSGDALLEFEKALSVREDLTYRIALGSAQLDLGKLEEARENFEKALREQSKNIKALQGLSSVHHRQGDPQRALERLRQAEEVAPQDPVTSFNLGVLYDELGKSNEAIGAFERTSRAAPQSLPAFMQLGVLYQRSGMWRESERALSRASEIDPNQAQIYRALGVAQEKLQELERAELSFRRAVDIEASDVFSSTRLATLLLQKKQEAKALEVVERALLVAPQQSALHNLKGRAEMELGKFPEAEQSFQKALDLDALNASAHNNLGILFLRMNRPDDARREFESALKLDPQLEEAKKNIEQL